MCKIQMILTLDDIQLEDRRKFSRLGKEFFFFDDKEEFDPLKESQKFHKFFSLNLPENISENFLSKENITLYLLDYYKFALTKKTNGILSKDTVRDSLLKWFFTKSTLEKESNLHTIFKLSKANNLPFYDELLLSSFIIRDKNLIKDFSLIDRKLEYLTAMEATENDVHLKLMMNLIKSLYYIDIEEIETALYAINEIETSGGFSPNAAFYKSVIMLKTEQFEQAEILVDKLVEYDLSRISYAVENNNLKFFEMLIRNSFLQKFFLLNEGPLLTEKITTLNLIVQKKSELIAKINAAMKGLSQEMFSEYKSDEIKSKISFIEFIIAKYGNSKSFYFTTSLDFLNTKCRSILNEISSNIDQKFEKMINDLLVRYDEKINTNRDLLRTLEENNRDIIQKEDAKFQKVLTEYENKINHELKYFEDLLSRFDNDSNNSSFSSIKNSMLYNGLFSLFVLLSGGFAEYSNSYVADIANIGSVISIVIMGGLKWGTISFIIGIFISIFMLLSTLHQRYSAKNNLVQRISNLNTEKEQGKNAIRSKHEQKKKHHEEKYEKSKIRLNEEIENYKNNKLEERKLLEEKFREERTTLHQPLEQLLQM